VAIDYDAIANNITPGTFSVCQAFLPDALPGALKNNPFKKDVAKAKQLLADAGLSGGFSVTMDYFSNSPNSDIAQAVQADLAAIGIKVQLLPGERKQVITKTRARQHQLAMLTWGTDYFDPNSNAQAFCANPDDSDNSKLKIIAWRNHFANKELTDEVDQAAQELDTQKRVALYNKMQQQFWDDSPIAFMLQQNAVAVARKDVAGFHLGPQSDFVRYGKTRKS
jgi:peptide/nickel transport system substrate-binding protein